MELAQSLSTDGKATLYTGTFPAGVYYLQIHDGPVVLKSHKLVITH